MIKEAASSRWLAFAMALCLQIAAGRDHIFDLKIRDGQAFEEKEFAGLLPTPVFDIRADATPDSVAKMRKEAPEGSPRGKLERSESEIIENLPGDDLFGTVDYKFLPGDTGVEKISLDSSRVVPSRGRLERFYGAMVRLLGPPQRLDREALYGRPNRGTLSFMWAGDANHLVLFLENNEAYFNVTLSYYPGEDNATYGRVLAYLRQEISDDPAASLKAYLDHVAKLPAGDGPPAPPAAAGDEEGCFRQYHEAYMLRFGRKWRVVDKPQIAVLNKALAHRYRGLGNQKTCERLLGIIRGGEPGLEAYEVRKGAEAYLASLKMPEAIPCMFEVLRLQSGLPSGPAVGGLAARCEGEVLDRVLRLLEAGGDSADQAVAILSEIRDPELRVKAGRKLPELKSADAKKKAEWALALARRLAAIE